MKRKNKVILGSLFFSVLFLNSAQANFMNSVQCEPLRTEITEQEMQEENNKFFHVNPYTVEGCDLGFDFPGFGLDFNLSAGLDFCALAKNATSEAREKWSDAVDEVEEWTNNTIEGNLEDGVSVNDENVVGGVGDQGGAVTTPNASGGSYSSSYTPKYDSRGFPIYD